MGPMQRMNRLISPPFQGRGRATSSSSPASVGIGTWEKSYSMLLVNIWIGAMGSHQVFLEEDQVRRLLGDIHGRIHRDADIRGMQRGSIVDSVSHEADHMSLAAEKADDPLLVSRSKTREERCLFRRIRQLRVGHLLHGLAKEH